MISAGFRISVSAVLALGEGRGGEDVNRLLASAQRSRQALMLHAVAVRAAASGHPHAAFAEAGYKLLIRAESADPQAAAMLLRYPAVSAWAIETIAALRGTSPNSAPVARLAMIAASAAIRAGVDFELEVPVTAADRVLALPSLGHLILPALTGDVVAHLRYERGAVELIAAQLTTRLTEPYGRDTPTWLGLRRLITRHGWQNLSVPFDDIDAYRFPPGIELADRLDHSEFSWWRRCFAEAWHILAARHAVVAGEVAALVTALSPIAGAPGSRRNASSRVVSGAVAVTRPSRSVDLALALAHEIQHIKLGILMDLFRLTELASTELYYAPWRSDPRPLHALLQGAYAHAGVAEFWLRESTALSEASARVRALAEFVRWRDASDQVAKFLVAHPGLTEQGRLFAGGLSRRLKDLQQIPVPSGASRLAAEAARSHRARWETDNHGISAVREIPR